MEDYSPRYQIIRGSVSSTSAGISAGAGSTHTHLFSRLPRLSLPAALADYLLFDMSIERKPEELSTSKDV